MLVLTVADVALSARRLAPNRSIVAPLAGDRQRAREQIAAIQARLAATNRARGRLGAKATDDEHCSVQAARYRDWQQLNDKDSF
jgi:hypothetical protein